MSDVAKFSLLVNGFDVELSVSYDTLEQVVDFSNILKENPAFAPRPRFQKNDAAKFQPFSGEVIKTETSKKKMGDKERDICLATLKVDKASWPDGPDEFVVMYWPPQKTWRVGEKADVVKGAYGPELKETPTEEPF